MSVSTKDVEKIAYLARLQLSTEETASLAKDLSNILTLVEQMDAVDTTAIKPMAHALPYPQRLREDVVTEHDQHQALLALSAKTDGDYYLVPPVIE